MHSQKFKKRPAETKVGYAIYIGLCKALYIYMCIEDFVVVHTFDCIHDIT